MVLGRDEILDLLQRFAAEPWSTGDVDALDDLVTADYTLQDGSGGLQELKDAIRETRAGLPDLTVSLSDVIVEGDRVAYRWTMRGTHQGEIEGIPPTGKSVAYTGITLLRLDGGKVAEDQYESSSPSAAEQLAGPAAT